MKQRAQRTFNCSSPHSPGWMTHTILLLKYDVKISILENEDQPHLSLSTTLKFPYCFGEQNPFLTRRAVNIQSAVQGIKSQFFYDTACASEYQFMRYSGCNSESKSNRRKY